MNAAVALTGINLLSLQDAFTGSEDILKQMLVLFETQARERMVQLRAALDAWDVMAARPCLHSLVNISGAVHAYGMSEQSKSLSEAVKRDERVLAGQLVTALEREAELVLRQTGVLLAALDKNPDSVWQARLPQ